MSSDHRTGPPELSQWFWDIVQRAKQNPCKLKALLQSLRNDHVLRFAMEFEDAASWLRGSEYARYLGYGSEDHVADASYWVVSQGQQLFTRAWRQPEAVAVFDGVTESDAAAQCLCCVAEKILYERLGDDSYDDEQWDIQQALEDFTASGYTTIADFVDARRSNVP